MANHSRGLLCKILMKTGSIKVPESGLLDRFIRFLMFCPFWSKNHQIIRQFRMGWGPTVEVGLGLVVRS